MHRNVSRKRGHQTTTVTYRTAGGNAVPWIDYVPILNGTALFFGTQGLFHIPLTLLVNQEDFEEDKDFFIEITSVEDGVVSQGKDRVRIVIQDDLGVCMCVCVCVCVVYVCVCVCVCVCL